MTKIERVDRVLSGGEPDRPPVSLWYHFGHQHGGGREFAEITLEFFRYYDLDFLKVMNDYYYPLPQGLEEVKSGEDLKRIAPFDVEKCEWREQFTALEIIAERLSGRAYFLDTVFDAWQCLLRSLAGRRVYELMEREPEALLQALEVITDNLIAYCRKSLSLGTTGIFMSVPAAAEIVSRERFLTFVKPFTMKLFSAIAGLGKMNTAHIHGDDLFFDDIVDLPVNILSWWDRGPNGPSLAYGKEKFPGCVMGGIDQTLVTRNTIPFLRNHVREGLELGGRNRFFLANGCSIENWAYPGAISAVVRAGRGEV